MARRLRSFMARPRISSPVTLLFLGGEGDPLRVMPCGSDRKVPEEAFVTSAERRISPGMLQGNRGWGLTVDSEIVCGIVTDCVLSPGNTEN
jgi:hypothetical protein